MPELNEMLEISPGKVANLILRSRDADIITKTSDDDADAGFDGPDGDRETVPEDSTAYLVRQELKEFLEALNEDEQASLIALAWIGKGTYAPGEIAEAIAAARLEHGANAPAYLLSLPLLPDYLEDALQEFGISMEETADEVMHSDQIE